MWGLELQIQAEFFQARKSSAHFVEHMGIALREEKLDHAPSFAMANDFFHVSGVAGTLHVEG
jgi:hypothetical protein